MSDYQSTVDAAPPRAPAVTELLLDVQPDEADPAELLAWTDRLVSETAPDTASLAIRLTDAETMHSLNRRYRAKDSATDVLSFPGEVGPEGRHLGDIVIAVPIAARQAEAVGHSLTTELETLILHGVLHCLGHDHETDEGEMEALEVRLRARWVTADG